jgi:hypothetical protein
MSFEKSLVPKNYRPLSSSMSHGQEQPLSCERVLTISPDSCEGRQRSTPHQPKATRQRKAFQGFSNDYPAGGKGCFSQLVDIVTNTQRREPQPAPTRKEKTLLVGGPKNPMP